MLINNYFKSLSIFAQLWLFIMYMFFGWSDKSHPIKNEDEWYQDRHSIYIKYHVNEPLEPKIVISLFEECVLFIQVNTDTWGYVLWNKVRWPIHYKSLEKGEVTIKLDKETTQLWPSLVENDFADENGKKEMISFFKTFEKKLNQEDLFFNAKIASDKTIFITPAAELHEVQFQLVGQTYFNLPLGALLQVLRKDDKGKTARSEVYYPSRDLLGMKGNGEEFWFSTDKNYKILRNNLGRDLANDHWLYDSKHGDTVQLARVHLPAMANQMADMITGHKRKVFFIATGISINALIDPIVALLTFTQDTEAMLFYRTENIEEEIFVAALDYLKSLFPERFSIHYFYPSSNKDPNSWLFKKQFDLQEAKEILRHFEKQPNSEKGRDFFVVTGEENFIRTSVTYLSETYGYEAGDYLGIMFA